MYGSLFSMVIMLSPLIYRMFYLNVAIVKYHHHFFQFVWHSVPYSKWPGKRVCSFSCSLLVQLGLNIDFSKSALHLTQAF